MFRRLGNWLSHYDWAAIVGSGLFLCFVLFVGVPGARGVTSHARNPQQEQCYAAADQSGVFKQIPCVTFWQRTRDDPISFYTLILATFTVVLGIGTLMLWWVTERTLGHAEATSERQLRAYIHVAEARIDDFGDGEHPRGVVKLKNFGQTPAYAVTQSAIIGYFPFPLTLPPPVLIRGDEPETILGPGSHITAEPLLNTETMTNQKIAATENGTHAIFILGEIRYRDCFGVARYTKYSLFSGARVITLGHTSTTIGGNEAN